MEDMADLVTANPVQRRIRHVLQEQPRWRRGSFTHALWFAHLAHPPIG